LFDLQRGRNGGSSFLLDRGGHAEIDDRRSIFAARFLEGVNTASDVTALGGEEHGSLLGDEALLVGLEAAHVERAPAIGGAGFDDFVEALSFAFTLHDAFL